MRIITLLFIFSAVSSSSGLQGRSFQDYIQALASLSPKSLESRTEIPQDGLDGIPAAILQEAGLLGYSRWELRGQESNYRLDVFEVLDSLAAFGLFTRTRESAVQGERTQLGVDSLLENGTLHFWRGHFFLRLQPLEGSSRDGLLDLARQLVDAIEEPNLHPMSVVQLPREDLVRDSIRYYLGPNGLRENKEFPLPLRDLLGFDDYAEVAMGRYGPSEMPLFVIGYPTASLAEHYFSEIQVGLQQYFSREGVYTKRSGLLISLFSGPEEQANLLLDRVQYTASVRWLYEKDTSLEDAAQRRGEVVTFLGVVSQSILFTGIFIVFVLAVGLLFGMLRFWLLRRIPALQHRDDMVRLDLNVPSSETP